MPSFCEYLRNAVLKLICLKNRLMGLCRVFEELDKLAHVNVDLDETLNQFRDSEISNGSFSA